MGGYNSTLSKTTQDITNKTINEITKNITNNCVTDNSNIQSIDISFEGIRGCSNINISDIGQTINASMTQNCTQTNIDTTMLQTVMNNNLDAYTEALRTSGSLALAEITESETYINLKNEVNNIQTLNNISNAISSQINEQTINAKIKDVVCSPYTDAEGNMVGATLNLSDVSQVMVSSIVANVLQSNTNLTTALSNFDNTVKTETKATALGLFDGIAAASAGLIAMAVLFLLGPLMIFLLPKMIGGGGGPSNGYKVMLIVLLLLLFVAIAVMAIMYNNENLKNGAKDISLALMCITIIIGSIAYILTCINVFRAKAVQETAITKRGPIEVNFGTSKRSFGAVGSNKVVLILTSLSWITFTATFIGFMVHTSAAIKDVE